MNKLHWYINRLALMDPREILHRAGQEVGKKYERIFFKDFSPNIELEHKKVVWFFGQDSRRETISRLNALNIYDEAPAQKLLQHKISFFSLNDCDLGETIDWHRDYKNNRQSPLKYCKDIDYRDFNQVGDFKYIWEINRHQFMITLAKAYFVTGKEEYKKEVIHLIEGWINKNPYKQGINWESSLEFGVRLISWAWVWFYIGETEKSFRDKWLDSIYKHCKVIAETYASYSSANNHLIGEVAGLYIATTVWPFVDKGAKWRQEAYTFLTNEIKEQTFPDGVNKEQAMSYSQFVFDFFLLAGLLGDKNGQRFPSGYWKTLERMAEFMASVMDKNGQMPNIGDSDDGFAVILDEKESFNPYRSIMASAAFMFNRPDFKSKALQFDEKSFWLFSRLGAERFKEMPAEPFRLRRDFKEGGYYILGKNDGEANEVKAVFDCGPLGYLSLAAHGHADSLSFTLNVSGERFLIDPGTYVYQNPKEWRNYFKGTAAHNTICVDGENQSYIGGNFMWLKKAKSVLTDWESTESFDRVSGWHDGYKRLKDPVEHQRELYYDKQKNVFTIKDELRAKDGHNVEQYFHFAQECSLKEEKPGTWVITNGNEKIKMVFDPALKIAYYSGQTNPIFGWQSTRFDTKEPAHTLVASGQSQGNTTLETRIIIGG